MIRLIFILCVLYACPCSGQISVKVLFNNTFDLKEMSEDAKQIKSLLNKDELNRNLFANDNITDKHLNIQVSFFDQGYLGVLKLKNSSIVTVSEYIDEWKAVHENSNAILILFVKLKDGSKYDFVDLVITNNLEEEYMLPRINQFLKSKMTGDYPNVISNFSKHISKILLPIWNDQKMSQASALIDNNDKYKAGHTNFFHSWFKFGFFNFKPASENEVKNLKLVNCWPNENSTSGNWYFSDKYVFTDDSYLSGFDASKIYDWGISFEKDNISGVYIFKDAFLHSILTYLEATKKHHSTKIASEYGWIYDKDHSPARYIPDFSEFKDRKQQDKLILYFDESLDLNEGDLMPKLSPASQNTWCNVFACDLANEVLFGNIFGDVHSGPWGSNNCANALHYRISNDKVNFIEVPLEEAWQYSLKGYIVYLTMFNKSMDPDMLSGQYTEKSLCNNWRSGHISICFPKVEDLASIQQYRTNNYVIQAGSSIGVLRFDEAISGQYNDKVKAYIYLGYILK